MPCGRMSIASRSRSWDLRASAIAASASARVRSMSEGSMARSVGASVGARRRCGLVTAFPGRPKIRDAGTGFRFFCLVGRFFGITDLELATQRLPLVGEVLKKWYLLAVATLFRICALWRRRPADLPVWRAVLQP